MALCSMRITDIWDAVAPVTSSDPTVMKFLPYEPL